MTAQKKPKETICVAIVTFNRLSKLRKALFSISQQDIKPDTVFIFDNGSNKDTKLFLEKWKEQREDFRKYVMSSQENKGGSYGFFKCQKYAVEEGFDWVLLIDDDAYLNKNYILQLLSFKNINNVVGICGKVWQLGSFENDHRAVIGNKWKRDFKINLTFENTNEEYKEIELFSFVGIMLRTSAIRKAGYPDKDFFIWYDDTEQSLRINKIGKLICLTTTSIFHDITPERNSINWKTYYGVRNNVLVFKKHFPIQFFFVFAFSFIKFSIRFIRNRNFKEYKMRLAGLFDGLVGRTGKNKNYAPINEHTSE